MSGHSGEMFYASRPIHKMEHIMNANTLCVLSVRLFLSIVEAIYLQTTPLNPPAHYPIPLGGSLELQLDVE